MTLSQLRRRLAALMRRFARELDLIKARRIAEAVFNDYDPADPPEPIRVMGRFADAGVRSFNYGNLIEYLEEYQRKGEQPNPFTMVRKLFPYAWEHRYDGFFRWDLPPDPYVRPPIPDWCR